MQIGVPKEIKNHEYRAGMTPSSVYELTQRNHDVFVETNLGAGIGHCDDAYAAAGATVLATADEVFEKAQMIVCLLYTSPSPRDATLSRMPSSA